MISPGPPHQESALPTLNRSGIPKLEVAGLTKVYRDGAVVAVDDISFTVESGETLALLGPSGCGKSTTLNMIVGLEQPSSGDIRIDGRSVIDVPAGRRDVGLVFQDYAVFAAMSVRDNLAFGLKVRKTDKAVVRSEVHKIAELLGLTECLDIKAGRLSGSEQQRVAIGRTLVTRPALLLLDEPLSNLEASARPAVRQELRRLQQELHLSIIYVTHDQTEALSLADRVAIMNHGKIIQAEETLRIMQFPGHVQVAQFLGSPPMNILRGRLADAEGGVKFTHAAFTVLFPACTLPALVRERGANKQYALGFRAEDLTLVPPEQGLWQGEILGVEIRGGDAVVNLSSHGSPLQCVVEHKLKAAPCAGLPPTRNAGGCNPSGLKTGTTLTAVRSADGLPAALENPSASGDFSLSKGTPVGLTLAPETVVLFDGDSNLRLESAFVPVPQ
jgi:multiple sugar transport system ATP-binding protein